MEMDELVAVICLVPVAAVVAFLVRLATTRRLERLRAAPPPRIFPELPLRHAIPFRRCRPAPLLKGLPNFGLVFYIANFAPLFVFMMLGPIGARGLFVNLPPTRSMLSQYPGPEKTLGVYVDGKSRFFVNGEPVEREDLERKLKEQLSTRLARFVYFEADGDCLYIDAAYTIDVIQGLGARVIWITPNTRAEIEGGRNRLR